MIHLVDVTFNAVAIPFAARVLLHVVPAPANTRVSDVMDMVITHPDVSFTNVIEVQIG